MLLGYLAGPGVKDAERANDLSVVGLERGAGIEANSFFFEERVVGELLIVGGVRDDDAGVAEGDLTADGEVSRGLCDVVCVVSVFGETALCLPEASLAVHHRNQGDGRVKEACEFGCQVVKDFCFRTIEDIDSLHLLYGGVHFFLCRVFFLDLRCGREGWCGGVKEGGEVFLQKLKGADDVLGVLDGDAAAEVRELALRTEHGCDDDGVGEAKANLVTSHTHVTDRARRDADDADDVGRRVLEELYGVGGGGISGDDLHKCRFGEDLKGEVTGDLICEVSGGDA